MYTLNTLVTLLALSANSLAQGPFAVVSNGDGFLQELSEPAPAAAAPVAPAQPAVPAPAPSSVAPAPVTTTTSLAPTTTSSTSTVAAEPSIPGGAFEEQTTPTADAVASDLAPVVSSAAAIVSALLPTLTPAVIPPVVTPAPNPGPGGNDGGMTIQVINSFTDGLSVSYADNAGGPGAIGSPTQGALALGSTTTVTYPTGWAGRIYVGPGPNIDPAGTKIEGSTTGGPDIDVSYVDGYSVPIVCSVGGVPQSGCNIDLFSEGTCPDNVDGVCHNPAQNIPNGPAPAFFAPCVGAAYTFPNDNVANVGNLPSSLVTCIIGTSIEAPARQGFMPNVASKRDALSTQKRSIQSELQRAAKMEQRIRARAANMFSKAV